MKGLIVDHRNGLAAKAGPGMRRTWELKYTVLLCASMQPIRSLALVALTRCSNAASVDFARTRIMYAVAHHDAWSCTDLHHGSGLASAGYSVNRSCSCKGRVRATDFERFQFPGILGADD